jgi:hypothetical protein
MKTICTNVYLFSELSESAQENAISQYRNNRNRGDDCSFYYDELKDSINAMCDVFGIKTGNTYSDLRFGMIDDNILHLSGVRLYKYIMNNYYSDLFKPVYIKLIDKPIKCKQFICKIGAKGDYAQIYSRLKKDNSCVLTV